MDVGGIFGIGARSVAVDMGSVERMRADGGNEMRAVVATAADRIRALPAVQ